MAGERQTAVRAQVAWPTLIRTEAAGVVVERTAWLHLQRLACLVDRTRRRGSTEEKVGCAQHVTLNQRPELRARSTRSIVAFWARRFLGVRVGRRSSESLLSAGPRDSLRAGPAMITGLVIEGSALGEGRSALSIREGFTGGYSDVAHEWSDVDGRPQKMSSLDASRSPNTRSRPDAEAIDCLCRAPVDADDTSRDLRAVSRETAQCQRQRRLWRSGKSRRSQWISRWISLWITLGITMWILNVLPSSFLAVPDDRLVIDEGHRRPRARTP